MKNKYKLSIELYKNDNGDKMIHYTCVDCGERNIHLWYGRDIHICNECEKETNIFGYETA